MRPAAVILILSIIFPPNTAHSKPLIFSSGPNKVALLELYTSQGCSSCPPADAWLSQLKDSPSLWQQLVPVAFHVDYWDYIGWRDPFADQRYNRRQRDYLKSGNIKSVYTPGFVYAGEEWRGFFKLFSRNKLPDINTETMTLSLTINDKAYSAKAGNINPKHEQLTLHLALLGMDIETSVKAGENKGKTLKENFVVLAYDATQQSEAIWHGLLPGNTHNYTTQAIAAWITASNNPTPLQATGGWLKE